VAVLLGSLVIDLALLCRCLDFDLDYFFLPFFYWLILLSLLLLLKFRLSYIEIESARPTSDVLNWSPNNLHSIES